MGADLMICGLVSITRAVRMDTQPSAKLKNDALLSDEGSPEISRPDIT